MARLNNFKKEIGKKISEVKTELEVAQRTVSVLCV